MHIEKAYTIDAPISAVWTVLNDRDAVSKCIPDLQSMDEHDNAHFTLMVKPTLAFISGSLTMKCTVLTIDHHKGKVKIEGSSIGSTFTATTTLSLSDAKGKTVVLWEVDVTREGLLKPIPDSIIKASALYIADKLFKNIEKAVKGT